ncbi:hypothetical protein D3C72_1470930 [compost metagenome]
MIGQPVLSSHFLATASCTAMPPPLATRRPEKSTLLISGLLISALYSVLTAGNMLNLYFCSSLMKPGMSRGFGISTLVPPLRMPSRQQTVSAKMW